MLSPTSFANYWTLGREELSACSNADAARLVGTIKAASVGGLFHSASQCEANRQTAKADLRRLISDKPPPFFPSSGDAAHADNVCSSSLRDDAGSAVPVSGDSWAQLPKSPPDTYRVSAFGHVEACRPVLKMSVSRGCSQPIDATLYLKRKSWGSDAGAFNMPLRLPS